MSETEVSDLKKISDDLSKELHAKHDLKHTETVEKIVLPTKQGKCAIWIAILIFMLFSGCLEAIH